MTDHSRKKGTRAKRLRWTVQQKKKNGKSAGSAAKKLVAETHRGNRRKRAEEGEGDGEEDGEEEPQLKKRSRKAGEKATVPEVPRHAPRLRGADPENADAGGR
ncbi:hypothetical protein B0H14DRAFT_2626948 [Mycena olivaceomarginata]|nr:hypothetical protein B0H14DRAFT_2626948 [Mycena olivaceomarginata]